MRGDRLGVGSFLMGWWVRGRGWRVGDREGGGGFFWEVEEGLRYCNCYQDSWLIPIGRFADRGELIA